MSLFQASTHPVQNHQFIMRGLFSVMICFVNYVLSISFVMCMVFIRVLLSCTICNTSSLVMCSFQLIFNLFQIHISKVSKRLTSSRIVHVSDAYSVTLHVKLLAILFFSCKSSFPLNNSFLFLNASLPITKHFLISR